MYDSNMSSGGVGSVGELLAGIEQLAAGPELAQRLAAAAQAKLTATEVVAVMKAAQQMVSHFQAQKYQAMAKIWEHYDGGPSSDDPEADFRGATQEIRAALRLTRQAATQELNTALDLYQRLPQLGQALAQGMVDYRRAQVYIHATGHLSEHVAQLVVDQTIDQAWRLTGGQLQALLRYFCIKVEPDTAQQQYDDELADRRVVSNPNPAGTATLMGINLAPDRVEAALSRVDHIAASLRKDGDSRSLDQLRADVFLDLLAGHPLERASTGRGMVDLRVDLATLTRQSDEPGELGGYGPVVADLARQLAEAQTDSEWRFAVTDPDTGQIVVDGITRRRPLTRQRRSVEARSPTCIFPGCRMPATQSDLDHRQPWSEGGATDEDNLDPNCRYDHVIRHHHGWNYQPLENGDFLWTSPLGLTYTTSGSSPPQAA